MGRRKVDSGNCGRVDAVNTFVEQIKLVVQTEGKRFVEDPAGFTSKDDKKHISKIKAICRQNAIPYSDEFVSLHVYKPKPISFRLPAGRTVKKASRVEAFGKFEVELRAEVAKEIVIVCAGDFQNLILNSESKGCAYLQERICVLSGKSIEERWQILNAFADKQGRGYTEARLFRALKTCDKAK